MKTKCILYLFICITQYINASETPDIDATNMLLGMKRKRAHTDTEIKYKNVRHHTTVKYKENNTVIEIPTVEVLRTRFKKQNYHALLNDTTILAQLKNQNQTLSSIYTTVDEACTKFYPHRDYDTFLTKLYHKDQIVRIILRDFPEIITTLEHRGKILKTTE